MDFATMHLWAVAAMTVIALIRFAPGAILIIGFAVVLAGPSLEAKLEKKCQPTTNPASCCSASAP